MREAFAQLEREGLVTVLPRIGAFVRSVSVRDVDEIYTVRSALEMPRRTTGRRPHHGA